LRNTSCDKLVSDSFARVRRVISPALTYSHHCINKYSAFILIFGEFFKSAENPCRKRFDINPETSRRYISGTVRYIATILATDVPRVTVYFLYFLTDFCFESLFLGNFLAAFRDIFERE
jgi:hypothetical protein